MDEIATLDMPAQEKILRAVEYGVFERVGGTTEVYSDARVIGATNADLPTLAEKGRFKRDLLDRLSFLVLTVPPLRRREDDILLLARKFASDMALELGLSHTPEFSPEVEEALLAHSWPGNVRELKNVVERAVFTSGEAVRELQFDPFASPFRPREANGTGLCVSGKTPSLEDPERLPGVRSSGPRYDLSVPLPDQVDRLKRDLMRQALRVSRFNQRKAAESLGLSYNQFRALYRKLETEEQGE